MTDAPAEPTSRLAVLKTYKLYVGGAFPRTESGRFDQVSGPDGEVIANYCRSSRKDFREAVVSARAAFSGWAARSAFNRSQILYRIAEMLEGRRSQFETELQALGTTPAEAAAEVEAAVDRLVHYAGWCDKYQQIFSCVNPVSSSHFNFSILEPTGVVAIYAPDECPLLGLVSVLAPAVAGGNTVVLLASESRPLPAITFAEVAHSSDVPGGVMNILTGRRAELLEFFASHLDVNAFVYCGRDEEAIKEAERLAAGNVKRLVVDRRSDWFSDDAQSPYRISDLQEVKSTWHPIGT